VSDDDVWNDDAPRPVSHDETKARWADGVPGNVVTSSDWSAWNSVHTFNSINTETPKWSSTYDPHIRVGYCRFVAGVESVRQVPLDDERLIVDLGADGRVLGIESLSGPVSFSDVCDVLRRCRWEDR